MRLSDPTHVQLGDLREWLESLAAIDGSPSPVDWEALKRGARERAVFLREFVIDDCVPKMENGKPRPEIIRSTRVFADAPVSASASAPVDVPALPDFVAQVRPSNGA